MGRGDGTIPRWDLPVGIMDSSRLGGAGDNAQPGEIRPVNKRIRRHDGGPWESEDLMSLSPLRGFGWGGSNPRACALGYNSFAPPGLGVARDGWAVTRLAGTLALPSRAFRACDRGGGDGSANNGPPFSTAGEESPELGAATSRWASLGPFLQCRGAGLRCVDQQVAQE